MTGPASAPLADGLPGADAPTVAAAQERVKECRVKPLLRM